MQKVRKARELARELARARDGDGSQLGILESEFVSAALADYAKRRRRRIVATIAAPFVMLAVGYMADLNGDGARNMLDAHAALNLLSHGEATRFTRQVEHRGSIWDTVYELPSHGAEFRVVRMTRIGPAPDPASFTHAALP